MKLDEENIIQAYKSGQSLSVIAKTYNSYATTISRLLKRNGVELRHDRIKEGDYCVSEGEKLIEWAKAQHRLVTKSELAHVIGKKRLSPSYFMKYPELGQYVVADITTEFQTYYNTLYSWLKTNNILYKPGDRTFLKMSVDALLLGEYSGIAIQLDMKPTNISVSRYKTSMTELKKRAKTADVKLILLETCDFDDLDNLKEILDSVKRK